MNRNNFLIHLALAIVLILIAAFAGQLNRWRKDWKNRVGMFPVAQKKRRIVTGTAIGEPLAIGA